MKLARLCGVIVLVGALNSFAAAQAPKQDPSPSADVEELARSNIGVACNPSGEWQCSMPKADEPKK